MDVAGKYIDYPAVRESVKAQITAQMMSTMNTQEMRDNPFASLGIALVASLSDRLVDSLVSPEGLRSLVYHGRAQVGTSKSTRDNSSDAMPSYESRYKAHDIWVMMISPSDGDPATQTELVFSSHGIVGLEIFDNPPAQHRGSDRGGDARGAGGCVFGCPPDRKMPARGRFARS